MAALWQDVTKQLPHACKQHFLHWCGLVGLVEHINFLKWTLTNAQPGIFVAMSL